jgi:DNA polymerase III delta prime subunit
MIANGVFGRENELAVVRQRLAKRGSFLLHGPSGVGKTVLAREALCDHPEALYCPDSSSKQVVLRTMAAALARQDGAARRILGGPEGIKAKSALSLKGMVLDVLQAGEYWIVLDHLNRPSQAFAADIKEMARSAMTPVLGIARSDHMEDVGFLMPLFVDRSEKLELRPFDEVLARQFAQKTTEIAGIAADNLPEFVERVLELSRGNPGVICSLVNMAKLPKYRSGARIMVTPLYIDFRLRWESVGAR